MANSFGTSNASILTNIKPTNGLIVIGLFVLLAIGVIVAYIYMGSARTACPTTLHRTEKGRLLLKPMEKNFSDMNDFEQWWHSSGMNARCPIPVLTGEREKHHGEGTWPREQTSAQTPINKVDDYEFSRIFGVERNGRMDVPRQNFNVLLEKRTFDWADKPYSSDERRAKYAGLHEGFTTDGDLASEAMQRFGEKGESTDKEVAALVAKAYENDKDYEPVVTKLGVNHWEVNELVPRHRKEKYSDPSVDNRVVNTDNDAVDINFKYNEGRASNSAIDPFFPPDDGMLPWQSDRYARDPWYGPVPGMERMFGPSVDRADWVVDDPVGPHGLMLPQTPN